MALRALTGLECLDPALVLILNYTMGRGLEMTGFRDPKQAQRLAIDALDHGDVKRRHQGGDAPEKKVERLITIKRTYYPSWGKSAAMAALLIITLTAVLFRTLWNDSDKAVFRVLLAAAKGEAPQASDLMVFKDQVPLKKVREALCRNPQSPKEWEKLEKKLPDVDRSAGLSRERLIAPRAGIEQRRPRFLFETPYSLEQELSFILTIGAQNMADRIYAISKPPGDARRFSFSIPKEDNPLEPGRQYQWKVELDPEKHPDGVSLYAPDSVVFEVMEEALARQLTALGNTGNGVSDKLIRAAAFNAFGMARKALIELAVFPKTNSKDIQCIRRFLRCEAFVLLGDVKSFNLEKAHGPHPKSQKGGD